MGFIFKKITDESCVEHCVASDGASLSQLLEVFECFLRGCGYSFMGSLDICDYQEVEFEPEKKKETPEQ